MEKAETWVKDRMCSAGRTSSEFPALFPTALYPLLNDSYWAQSAGLGWIWDAEGCLK